MHRVCLRATQHAPDWPNYTGKTIDCEINEENVLNCSRVMKFNGNNNRPKSIVVQFNTQRLRDTFLAACINFNKKKNFNDKLNTSHLGLAGDKSPIFVTTESYKQVFTCGNALKSKRKGL